MKKIIQTLTIALLSILMTENTQAQTPAKMPLNDLPDGIYAQINTPKGIVLCYLEMEKAPLTVANFVALSEGKMPNNARPIGKPYYDGNKFHRVVPNFVIQGGDPANYGNPNLGYMFRNEIHPDLKHDKPGVLAMANAGPHTNSCQFYITHNSIPHLDGGYSVFGRVIKGQGVVNQIVQGDAMNSIYILRKGKVAKKFDALKTFNELKNKQ